MEKQLTRYSKKEFEILKSVFSENEALLLTVRNLFLGLEVSEDEKKVIKEVFADKEIRRIMRKFIIPEFDADLPVGMATDIWMSSVDGVKSNTPETLAPIFASQAVYIKMLETALALLEKPEGKKVKLEVKVSDDAVEMYKQILARNNFVKNIEQTLVMIRIYAGQKTETTDELIERLKKNSSK